MDNEYTREIRRLECNLDDNTALLISLSRALKSEIGWDMKDIPNTDELTIKDSKLIAKFGSKRTKLLYETIQTINDMRPLLCKAISLLKHADKLEL